MTAIREILKNGHPVKMKNPEPPPKFWEGTVERRVGVLDPGDLGGRDYFRTLDRIRMNDGKVIIRGGYYWKMHEDPDDAWTWGSQTSFSAGIALLRELVKKAEAAALW